MHHRHAHLIAPYQPSRQGPYGCPGQAGACPKPGAPEHLIGKACCRHDCHHACCQAQQTPIGLFVPPQYAACQSHIVAQCSVDSEQASQCWTLNWNTHTALCFAWMQAGALMNLPHDCLFDSTTAYPLHIQEC